MTPTITEAAMVDKRPTWFGYMTRANAEAIADKLRLMFEGKRFVSVFTQELSPERPEVYADRKLDKVTAHPDEDGRGAWITMPITGWLLMWSCRANSQTEVHREGFGSVKTGTYFSFDFDKVTIVSYAPVGQRIVQVLAVQHPEWDAR